MPDLSEARGDRDPILAISLHTVPSSLRASDGRDIPFARAVLSMRNDAPVEMADLAPHASLGQEGGTIQDVSGAFGGMAVTLPPGGALQWDVYDLLLPSHAGAASKIHMFGYRAALNWRFDLTAWAEYRLAGTAGLLRTPSARWALRWSLAGTPDGAVILTFEEPAG